MTVSRLRRCAPALVVVALAAGLAGCSSTLSDAATVEYPDGAGADTMHVDLNSFQQELEELTGSDPFRALLGAQQPPIPVTERNMASLIAAVWLGDLVTQTAVDREFDARGLTLTDADINQAKQMIIAPSESDPPLLVPNRMTPEVYKSFSEGYQRTLAERRARANAVLKSYESPSPAEIAEFYESYKDEFACRRVGHVLVKTRAEAEAVLAELEAGKAFADVAKASSTDTGSAENGGDLGCLQPGAYVEAFQTAADNAENDTPVGPVETEFGFHVILVRDQQPTLEQMGQQIANALKQGAAVKQSLVKVKVRVNPRFGSPGGTTGDQNTGAVVYQIQPPDVPSVANDRDATTTTTVPFVG